MDAASNNSVDDIRDLREKVSYAPVSGRHKVYILDEAHMLSQQAWNAFLKTLEEPPPRTIFVLATTEAQKVLPTVVDRCHRFDFGRPTVEQVATVVHRVATKEQIEIEPAAVALIARHATGSFRDALGTLEQLVTYAGPEPITSVDVLAVLGVADAEQLFEAIDAVIAHDPAQALRVAGRLTGSGRDPGQLIRDLEIHGRELLAVQVLGEVPAEVRITPERDARLLTQAQALPGTDVVRLLELVASALEATANGAQARIQLELVLIKAAAPEVDPSTKALLARIERLESALNATGTPAAAPPRPDEASLQPPRDAHPELVSPREAHPERVPPRDAHPESVSPGDAHPERIPPRDAHPERIPPQDAHPEPAPAEPGLDTLVASWPAVVDFVRQDNAMLAATLDAARPAQLSGQALTLAFPSGAAFFKRKAEQDDYRRATADALRSVTGAKLALRYELSDEGPANPDADSRLTGEELVRRFMDEFDAEEVLEDPDQEEAT
jgi:DNA polymerase-3 subunit gamma/tau